MSFVPNKVIKHLILSDLAFCTAWGLLTPVFAIFVLDRIEGGTPFVVGIAVACFWIVKAVVRIPISYLLDACPSEKDDYFVLVAGLSLSALVPFGFIFAKTTFQVYALQGFYGLASSALYAGWTAIFTRHIDRGKESTDWGLSATAVGITTGIASAVGGWSIMRYGFNPVFIAVGALNFIAVVFVLGLKKDIAGVFDNGWHFSFHNIFNSSQKPH